MGDRPIIRPPATQGKATQKTRPYIHDPREI